MGALGLASALVAQAACIVLPLFLLYGGYSLLFHPLRKYPGPWVAKFTDAYGGWFAAQRRLHLVAYHNFQEYGPVVRHAPNRLVFNTLAAVHDVCLHPTVTKGYAYRMTQLRSEFPSVFNTLDRDQHRRKRRIIGQALSERSVRAFEPTMSSQIDAFLRQILASCRQGRHVNMSELCQRLGIDIIVLLAFGFPLNTQSDDTHRPMLPIIDDLSWRINNYMQFPPIKPIEKVFASLGFARAFAFQQMIQTMIQTRRALDKDAFHDLYAVVANHMGKENQDFLQAELWPEAIFFIMAGGSTTTSAIAGLFFYLSRYPACRAALVSEIRSTFTAADEIVSGPKLASCKYLRACIDETLRISPASSGMLWREQAASKDGSDDGPFVVDGHVIPRGTQVGINLYCIFHNEEYFPDSFAFMPERWLESACESREQAEAREAMRRAFVPFLLGDRACAGKSLALLEMSLTLARTLWFFDMHAAPGEAGRVGGGEAGRTDGRGRPDEFQLYDEFVASHDGPNLVFRTRGDFWQSLEEKQQG